MNPELVKPILRGNTAYRAGRTITNVLLGLDVLGLVLLATYYITRAGSGDLTLGQSDLIVITGAIFSLLFTILLWAIAHAIFDAADAALARHETQS